MASLLGMESLLGNCQRSKEGRSDTTVNNKEHTSENEVSQISSQDFGSSWASSFSGPDGSGGKQRRRRTSPQDHAVLEAAYAQNPKPDKVVRTEIVKRVALGEKEVQIWFQNRRQMTRRRSHAPYRSDGDDQNTDSGQGSTEISFVSTSSGCESQQAEQKSSQSSVPDGEASMVTSNAAETTTISSVELEVRKILANSKRVTEVYQPCRILDPRAIEACRLRREESEFDTKAQIVSGPVAPVLHRRISNGEDTACAPYVKCPRRKVSNVRLSLTLEGKAEVTEGSTPLSAILPRFKPRPPIGLQRSQSAVEPKQKSSTDFVFPPLGNIGRGRPGRSRDARTWEFFCDGGDAQDALTKRAEGEQAGSAVSAISLIRQNSGSALKLNAIKRNATREREESCKRVKSIARQERGKLNRTQSSVARLQSSNPEKPRKQPRRSSLTDPWASGDSDKENWLPGTTEAPFRRVAPAPQVAGLSRGILRENMHLPSHSSCLDALLNSVKNSPKRKEKSQTSSNAMEDSASGSQDAEDLDCVQSLLSLSQGAWQ